MGALGRWLIVVTVVVGVFLYAVVVDWGLSAGRVHAGVAVQDLDLGGLTESEAAEVIAERGAQLGSEALVFISGAVECSFYPFEAGWKPRPFQTARAAMDVGRIGLPFRATIDRIRSWIGGVKVHWTDRTSAKKVGELLDECEENARPAGLLIDRGKFRYKIRRALARWPRKESYRIPTTTT